jgi:nucleoside-triphosphatase THEP1
MIMIDNPAAQIIGIVGKRGSGKTSLILSLLEEFQSQGMRIAGVISPGIFEGEQKIAIEMIDLVSREGRLLAILKDDEETGLQFGDWSFYEQTIKWGNQRLEYSPTCDILILDEVGPLELDFNQGLQQGLNKLAAGNYKLGMISLRPKCAEAIQQLFPRIELFYLETLGRKVIKETVFRIAINSLES